MVRSRLASMMVSPHLGAGGGAVAVAIALMALTGWLVHPGAAIWPPGSIPMAPSTALCFTFLGSGTLLLAWPLAGRFSRTGAAASAAMGVIMALAIAIEGAAGASWDLEAVLGRALWLPSGAIVGRMSPVTAIALTLAALALLLLASGRRAQDLTGTLALAVWSFGFLDVLSYLYGAPFFYGMGVTPVAFSTSLAFLALGTALLAALDPSAFPVLFFTGGSTRARLTRAFVPLVVGWALVDSLVDMAAQGRGANPALVRATTITLLVLLAGLVISRVSASIGDEIDRSAAAERQARAKLAEEYATLQGIIDSTDDAIFSVDRDCRYTHLNRRHARVMRALYGAQIEVGGSLLSSVSVAEDRERTKRNLDRALAGERFVEESSANGGGGGRLHLEVEHNPVRGPEGGILGVSVFARDVTARKRLDEELLKVQKLESVGLLAGGIAHDFNNILAVILGNVSFARSLSSGSAVSPLLSEAEEACERGRELSQRLLTFARGGEPVKKVLALPDLVRRSVALCLEGSDVSRELDLPEGVENVEADEGQILQVFFNLTLNAREAMPGGGTLRVRAANVDLGDGNDPPLPAGRYVEVSFQDQGVGVPPENLNRIFDPYFSTKERGSQKGQGLGLTICHSILKKHGGGISVESARGAGTTFHVYLPVAPAGVPRVPGS